jgi:hypothetical protein
LDVAIISLGNSLQKPVPNACLAPAVEAVHAGGVRAIPRRKCPPNALPSEMPFNTRRSSTRGTPRGLSGNKGWITDHSKSVRSKRAMMCSFWELESLFARFVNAFMGM